MSDQPSTTRPASSVPGSSGLPWKAAAVFAHLLLVSAAFETFLSRSPVRWWVVGCVGLYLVVVFAGWRFVSALRAQLNPRGLATAGGATFLVLLAGTAWLPGGTVAGIRVFGLPTATLLSAVSAAAVALAGISLIRLRVIPAWARYALGALAAYGVLSFLVGIASATPYTLLLHGGSFWTRLPFWLQGAFVGGLVVLPLGFTVMVVQQGPSYFRRAGSEDWTLQQAVALALSLVMTISGVAAPGRAPVRTADRQMPVDWQAGPPAIVPGAHVSINTHLELPPPPPPEPTTEELDARMKALAPRIPDERYNPEAQSRALGPGVDPAFSFVRDAIRYEAYSGVLRGADGTLAARAGNAFDRSLLLAKMLAVHGVRTRFVRGDLPKPEADTLFGRIFEKSLPPSAGDGSTGERATSATQFWVRLTARARRDYTAIRTALGNALPSSAQPSREQAFRDIQQHVWVQAELDGKWLDLDTSFATAKPGKAFCTATQTVDQMPLDWHQRVTMRVTEERLEDGALKATPALEATLSAVDLIDKEVFLVHAPGAGGQGGMGLGATGASRGADRWTPVLLVGEDLKAGGPIDFGDAEASSGYFDALGGGSSSAFVAEWLEFEVLRPDGRRDVTRRTLVDRATAAWRASEEHAPAALRPLARDNQGPVGPRAVRNIWFSGGPHNLRSFAATIEALTFGTPESSDPEAPLAVQLLPLATNNFAALVWADHTTIPAANDAPQVRLYSDSPRIIIVSVTPGAQGGVTEEYDLRRDWLFGLARDASADALVVDRKIWFAALEGALEHESVARDLATAGEDGSAVVSTSSLLTAEGVVALGPSDLNRLSQLTSDPEKAARLGAALRAGNVLAVPRAVLASGPGGWWEIAPGGDARAVLDDDLNMARINESGMPKGGTNSSGGAKQISTPKPITIKTPTPAPQGRFGKVTTPEEWAARRAAMKKQRAAGLEAALITAVMIVAVIGALWELSRVWKSTFGKAAEQLDVIDRASGAGR